jgi:hypothetical protein
VVPTDTERWDWVQNELSFDYGGNTYLNNWILGLAERFGVESSDVRDIIDAAMQYDES